MNKPGETLTAGVDLGGTKIQSVILRDGEVVGSARSATPQTGVAEDVILTIAETVRSALGEAPTSRLDGIGVGSPGEVDTAAGAVELAANVPGFHERVELGSELSKAMGGVEVAIGNDVQAGVVGEHRRGAGRPHRNLLGVWVGTGVGGGLILDGELHVGRGVAGEIGHIVVKPGGLQCSCGRRGCLEAYAGRARMERRAKRMVRQGHKTALFTIMKKRGRDRLTSGVYASALEQGDRLAKKLIEDAAWALGIALASSQNLLDDEAIIVGGGLGDRLGQPFVEQIVEQMTPRLFVPDKPPIVLRTELGDLSGAIGAALLVAGWCWRPAVRRLSTRSVPSRSDEPHP
jgi:glucokinase